MLPLRLRLPRPPAVFIGREEELRHLRTASVRAPVVVIGGEPGIGKSALVERFLFDEVRAPQPRANVACVRARDLGMLARQLAAAHSAEDAPREPAEIAAFLVELSSAHALTLVLEDAHELMPSNELTLLIDTFARYATPCARLLVVTRDRLALPHLAEQMLWLSPMKAADVLALVCACVPAETEEAHTRIVAASLGNPMLARQHALGGRADARAQLGNISPGALALAEVLASLSAPLPIACLEDLGLARDALRTHALLEERADAVALTPVARAVLSERRPTSAPLAAELTARLSGMKELADPVQLLELAVASGDEALVSSVLSGADESLVDAIGGARLTELLGACKGGQALRWRLLGAARAPNASALRWLATLPPPVEPRTRLAYARALGASGSRAEARAVYEELSSSTDDLEVALEATIGRVRVASASELLAVRERLVALEPLSEEDQLRRDVHIALVDHRSGEEARGRLVARRAYVQLHRLSRRRTLVARELLAAFAYLRLYAEARRLEIEHHVPLPFAADRLFNVTCVAVEAGDRSRTREALDRWDRVTDGAPRYRFLRAFIELRNGTHVDGARTLGRVRDLIELARALEDEDFLQSARICALEHAVRSGAKPDFEVAEPGLAGPDDEVGCWLALAKMRFDGAAHEAPAHAGTDRVAPLLRAEKSALMGDLATAARVLLEAVREAEHRASVLEAADYVDALGGVLLRMLEPQPALVQRCADAARRLAAEHELGELASLADGLLALTQSAGPPSDHLLAMPDSASHVVARIARAALARGELLTESDLAALRACRTRWARRTAVNIVLDARACSVSWPSGDQLDLSKHKLLFRMVELLLREPAGVTKEEFARGVWGLRAYAPERDDKRIQVAINRLRGLIAKQRLPPCVATTATGYAWRQPTER